MYSNTTITRRLVRLNVSLTLIPSETTADIDNFIDL